MGDLGALSDPSITRHFDNEWENSIRNIVRRVLDDAKTREQTTAASANRLAEEFAAQPHPIWGHRVMNIVRSLVADNWAEASQRA